MVASKSSCASLVVIERGHALVPRSLQLAELIVRASDFYTYLRNRKRARKCTRGALPVWRLARICLRVPIVR